MANSKKNIQVRCIICRKKSPSFSNMEALTSKMEKRGWKRHKDGRFTCSEHEE